MQVEKTLNFYFQKNDLSPTTQVHLSLNLRFKRKKQKEMEKGESIFQEPKVIRAMYSTSGSELRRKSILKISDTFHLSCKNQLLISTYFCTDAHYSKVF